MRTQQFVEIEDMSLFITWVWGGEFWGILWFSVGTEGGQSSLNDCSERGEYRKLTADGGRDH